MTYGTGLSVEERVASLFQPDTLLSAQYSETCRRKAHLEPEKRLMLAVLDDAIACFQKHIFAQDGKGATLFRQAEEWILEANSDRPFSFETICEVLGFNPDYVRKGLMRGKEKRLGERRRAALYPLTPTKKKNKEATNPDKLGGAMQRLLRAGGE